MNKIIRWSMTLVIAILVSGLALSITLDDSEGITDNCFENEGIWYEIVGDNEVELINPKYAETGKYSYSSTYSGEFIVPNTVTDSSGTEYSVIGIGSYAFYESTITSIELKEGLKYIDTKAFLNSQLNSIEIPSSVERIASDTSSSSTAPGFGGESVFWGNNNSTDSPLKEIKFAQRNQGGGESRTCNRTWSILQFGDNIH